MTTQSALKVADQRKIRSESWGEGPKDIFVGKDVLELLSSAMYLDALTIYREYIQNAADAIDEARSSGVMGKKETGRVEIKVDPDARTISIRDNGCGVRQREFTQRLTSLGGSKKRGTAARGFRGVGRLAGLGYCQQLTFRSRAAGETKVSELRWDCRQLREFLRSLEYAGDLSNLVERSVTVRHTIDDDAPEHFFEVRMEGVVRHKDDRLLSAAAIADYVSQVGPVPLSPDFKYAAEISERLMRSVPLDPLEITINESAPVYRPFRNRFAIGDCKFDHISGVKFWEIPGMDGAPAAIAWVATHGYHGSIPSAALIKGIRLRCGNIQVGENALLEELFPETRFNGWAVGEVHILDKRIVPNGRRDHFEQSAHLNNLFNHIAPIALEITRDCRSFSQKRKIIRDFELLAENVGHKIRAMRQGVLGPRVRQRLLREASELVSSMEKILAKSSLDADVRKKLLPLVEELRAKLKRRGAGKGSASPLSKLPPRDRKMYQKFFELIYNCSTNRVAAQVLVDRIITKIA